MSSCKLVRLRISCCIWFSRSAICVLITLGMRFSGTCCGVIRMTAWEIYVSGHMNATTTDKTRPANIGPMIHER